MLWGQGCTSDSGRSWADSEQLQNRRRFLPTLLPETLQGPGACACIGKGAVSQLVGAGGSTLDAGAGR